MGKKYTCTCTREQEGAAVVIMHSACLCVCVFRESTVQSYTKLQHTWSQIKAKAVYQPVIMLNRRTSFKIMILSSIMFYTAGTGWCNTAVISVFSTACAAAAAAKADSSKTHVSLISRRSFLFFLKFFSMRLQVKHGSKYILDNLRVVPHGEVGSRSSTQQVRDQACH